MLIAYILIAFFIAWIWVDYFRIIDIYDRGKMVYLVITFALGCGSVVIVYGIEYFLLARYGFGLNGEFLNDFLFATLNIGLVEELAKLVPFLIMLGLFKKQFTEPIDYFIYICTSALGFSAVENILYFQNYGSELLNGRAILSTVGHMFDSAIVAYGIILFKFKHKHTKVYLVPLFFILACLSHGFYDFWLLHEAFQGSFLITILYFLITISIFAVMLNNAMNNSRYFSYKNVVNSYFVSAQLLTYYLAIFLIQFLIIAITENFYYAMGHFLSSLFTEGFIVVITSVRLSRFKLIKNRWEPIKLEFPFRLHGGIQIKGDGVCESTINTFYQEYFYLKPLRASHSFLAGKRLAFIEEKIYLENDVAYYLCKLYKGSRESAAELFFIRGKRKGVSMKGDKPIVGLFKVEQLKLDQLNKLKAKELKFIEWALVEAIEEAKD